MIHNINDWWGTPEPETQWLVFGLLPSDDLCGFVGKPKSGKSLAIRNLVAAVINGTDFLGRTVSAEEQGRVLYVHLDRKDPVHCVTSELKHLGIKAEDQNRLRWRTHQHLPLKTDFKQRCDWLANEVLDFQPHLVIIDMMLHFVKTAKGVNDYDGMLDAMYALHDRLKETKFHGVLLVSLHSRKAVSEDIGDSILGSTGIRGSLSSVLYFRQYKKQKLYTVESDQTQRDPALGEIEETVVHKDTITGVITLGAKFEDLKGQEKKDEWELRRQKVYKYILQHSGETSEEIADAILMSKKTVVPLLQFLEDKSKIIYSMGEGKKGDPTKYFPVSAFKTPEVTEVKEVSCQTTLN